MQGFIFENIDSDIVMHKNKKLSGTNGTVALVPDNLSGVEVMRNFCYVIRRYTML